MTEQTPEPTRAETAERTRLERLAREAEALRNNLRRRKAQRHARAEREAEPQSEPPAAETE